MPVVHSVALLALLHRCRASVLATLLLVLCQRSIKVHDIEFAPLWHRLRLQIRPHLDSLLLYLRDRGRIHRRVLGLLRDRSQCNQLLLLVVLLVWGEDLDTCHLRSVDRVLVLALRVETAACSVHGI